MPGRSGRGFCEGSAGVPGRFLPASPLPWIASALPAPVPVLTGRGCFAQVARVPVRTFAEGDIPATLNLSFSTPGTQLFKNFEAKMVTMKGSSGVFGVLPGHVPTIAQLQPGVVTVDYDSDEGAQSDDFFVCGGFAYIKANSDCDVCAVEACKVEDIDAAEVGRLLTEVRAPRSATPAGHMSPVPISRGCVRRCLCRRIRR